MKNDDKLEIENYKWIGSNRKEIHRNAPKGSGGVGLFVKHWINQEYTSEIIDATYDGILCVKFTSKSTDLSFTVISCYLPPENSVWGRDSQSFFAHILSIMYSYNDCDAHIICGDLNARIGSLSDVSEFDSVPERSCIDKAINQHGHAFIDFLNESKTCVLNGRYDNSKNNYTCISGKGKSVVDYICVPHEALQTFISFEVRTIRSIVEKYDLFGYLNDRSKVPDHSVLETKLNTQINVDSISKKSGSAFKKRYKLKVIPNDFFASDISKQAIQTLITRIERTRETQSNIDGIYTDLCDTILKEMDDTIPCFAPSNKTKKRFRNHKPYWNEELSTLWKDMHFKERSFLKCTGNTNSKRLKRLQFQSAQKLFDRRLRFYERRHRNAFCEELETMTTKNPNEFWAKIRNMGPRKQSEIPMEVYDDERNILNDENEVCEKWKSEFEKMYNNTNANQDFDNEFYRQSLQHKNLLENNMLDPLYQCNEELNSNITIEEVSVVIKATKNGKATGLDKIPYEVLKSPNILPILLSLFQWIFDTSLIPSLWRKAILFPILKDMSSDKREPLNYRGVCLQSCISKLFSSFMNNRLTSYLEDNDLLADEQNGFRRQRSCEDHVFTLNSIIRNNQNIIATFVDLKKAFDFVDRDMLLYKLLLKNIDGKLYNSVKSIYSLTSASIRINNTMTDWFTCYSGVKQGDNLSPTLFSIFINDLVQEINNLELGIDIHSKKLSLLLYADDIVMFATNENDMQLMLNTLHNWCKKWRVLINTDKSKVVHFRSGRRPRTSFQFKIGDNMLQITEQYKYLGVIFHEKKTFESNADNLAKAGGRALGALISKVHGLKDCGVSTFQKLFYSCVAPIIDYNAAIWGFKGFNCIDNVQNKAIRYFLGVHKFAPKSAIIGDMGWLPSRHRHFQHMVRYWNRLMKMPDDRLCKQVFLWDYNRCNNNWSSDLKSVMNDIGLNHQFSNKLVCDLNTVNDSLVEKYAHEWFDMNENSPKLRTYKTFKSFFQIEPYVKMNLSKSERSMMAQFRCGILPLRIETGRYVGEPKHQRICRLCDTDNVIEDEIHFLTECCFYNDIRTELVNNINGLDTFKTLPKCEQLIQLVKYFPRQTSNFILKAYCKRRQFIYSK